MACSGVRPQEGACAPASGDPPTGRAAPGAGSFSAHARSPQPPLHLPFSDPASRGRHRSRVLSFLRVILLAPCDHGSAGSSVVTRTCSLSSGPPWGRLAAPTPSSRSGTCVLRVEGELDGVDHAEGPGLGSDSGEVLGSRGSVGQVWPRQGRACVKASLPEQVRWLRLRPLAPLQQFQVACCVPMECGTFAPGRPSGCYAHVNSPRLACCPSF